MLNSENHYRKCQLYTLPAISEPINIIDNIWQRRNRLKRIVKRRIRYIRNMLKEQFSKNSKPKSKHAKIQLKAGDLVRIRSREEIQKTLNRWNQLKGCAFMEEMWHYCGTTQRVRKPVRVFLDERNYLVRRSNHIFILENVICEGTIDFGPCDRSCFFFWREEWLEKIANEN
ncbi:MAG: hypothetical protein ACFFDN_11790 [Candidatus Hodarchaeota archaeon]